MCLLIKLRTACNALYNYSHCYNCQLYGWGFDLQLRHVASTKISRNLLENSSIKILHHHSLISWDREKYTPQLSTKYQRKNQTQRISRWKGLVKQVTRLWDSLRFIDSSLSIGIDDRLDSHIYPYWCNSSSFQFLFYFSLRVYLGKKGERKQKLDKTSNSLNLWTALVLCLVSTWSP